MLFDFAIVSLQGDPCVLGEVLVAADAVWVALDGVVEAGDLHFKGDLPAVVDAGVPGLPAVGLEGQDCQDLKDVAHRQLVAAREVGGVAGRLP